MLTDGLMRSQFALTHPRSVTAIQVENCWTVPRTKLGAPTPRTPERADGPSQQTLM
jgi:hypothetical protein